MSRNLDLLQAAYQLAGRDGVAATPGPWDCHDREQVLETFRRQYDQGCEPTSASPSRSATGHPRRAPHRHDEHGNKTDKQRLWRC
jgi:hypothetical protein